MKALAVVRAEWSRFIAHAVNRRIVLALAWVLLASAVWSGWDARAYRAEAAAQQVAWSTLYAQALSKAPATLPATAEEATKAVAAAHALGRGDLGMTWLAPTGGLVLGVDRFERLPTAVRATVESRYLEGRVTGPLVNPLLAGTGMLSFVAVMVLLLPLATLALTAGSVQEDREQGVWRLVCAQSRWGAAVAWGAALGVRWCVIVAVAATASGVAFLLDPGGELWPWLQWIGATALFAAFWVLAGGLVSLLPISASAARVAALGLWLALGFAVPSLLALRAEQVAPMPSRLSAIAQLRAVQQATEEQDSDLLSAWYARHPESRPDPELAPLRPTWPVTFMPRFEEQEKRIRPVMRRFDQARAAQDDFLRRHAWLSPSLSMVLVAESLAGIDAERYRRYADAVDGFEDAWRAFVTPAIMSYRGLDRLRMKALPRFDGDGTRTESGGGVMWRLFAVCVALLGVSISARRGLVRP